MDQRAEQEVSTPRPRNTVTLSLDGDSAQCLQSYRRALGHFRAWNRSNGIRVDVSSVYGDKREVYTTPPSGTFYFVVRSGGRKLTFVVQGRSGWLVGFYGQNGAHQLTLDEQDTPYMNCKDCNILSFRGNHRYISDGDPGSTSVGLHSIRNAFLILWAYLAQTPEPHQLRRAFGVFVVFLCEAPKNQAIFDRICRSYIDPSISRFDAENGLEMQLGECCQNWSKLSHEGMTDVEYRISHADQEVPQVNNYGIAMIVTAEDILRVIRILHSDAYGEGVFTHEPIPSPPQQWEPIDLGEGDSSEDEVVPSSDDDDSDDEYRRKGGRKKEKKYDKRRRTPQKIIRYVSEKRRGSGGEAINFPDHLIDTWNTLPVKKAEEITKDSFPAIMKLPNLQELTVAGCIGIDDDALGSLEKECNKSLQVLGLSQCQNITDVGVSSILKEVPNLLEMVLSYCCPVTPPMVRSFQKVPKLWTLKLEGCKFMPDALKAIGTSCVSLRELSLSKCSGVTDTELSFAVPRLKNLLKLEITCCYNITNVSLVLAVITSSCTSLVSLRMESCSRVSSGALQLIGKHCSHLEELDLTDSDLDDEGLKAFAKCSKLWRLKIGICLKISDEGLTHVGRSCPKNVEARSCAFQRINELLKVFDMSKCQNLTDFRVSSIVKSMSNLLELDPSYCCPEAKARAK